MQYQVQWDHINLGLEPAGHFERKLKEAITHLNSHNAIPTQSKQALFDEINRKPLWNNLKSQLNEEEYAQMEADWSKLKPLAPLSHQQLIDYIEERFIPLQNMANSIHAELKAAQEYYQTSDNWLSRDYESKYQWRHIQLQKLLIQIDAIGDSINHSIQARAEHGDLLHHFAGRVNSILLDELNCNGVEEEPLTDYERITLHDVVNDSERSIKEALSTAVKQKGSAQLIPTSTIRLHQQAINQFAQEMEEYYELTYQAKQSGQIKAQSRLYRFYAWLRDKALPTVVKDICMGLYRARWLLLQMGLLVGAIILGPAVNIWLTSNLGSLGGIISSALFYGGVLFPSWVMMVQFAGVALGWVKSRVSNHTNSDILNALNAIRKANVLVQNKLSTGVVDIKYFDAKSLQAKIDSNKRALTDAKSRLDNLSWLQRQCLGSKLPSINQIKSKLEEQGEYLERSAKTFAADCAARVDLALCQLAPNKNGELDITLKAQQIHQLRELVNQYGDNNAKQRFDEATDFNAFLIKAISRQKCLIKQEGAVSPWGGWCINDTAIRGWLILNQHINANPDKRAAVQTLLEGMLRRTTPTDDTIKHLARQIAPTERAGEFEKQLKNLVLLALPEFESGAIGVLTEPQQQRIQTWINQNQEHIETALSYITDIFDNSTEQEKIRKLNTKTFKRHLGFLSAAATANQPSSGLYNRVIALANSKLNQFDGSNAFAWVFARLIRNPQRRVHFLQQCAQRRLNWLLDKAQQGIMSSIESDILLFTHPRQTLNIHAFVREHSVFSSENNPSVKQFLTQLVEHGLVKNNILTQYDGLHTAPSCSIQKDNISSTLRRVGVCA